jgi:hypothetical protein
VAIDTPAQEAPPIDRVAEVTRAAAPLRIEVNSVLLPRFEAADTAFQAPRVDVSLLPPGGTGLGPLVGMTGFSSQPGLQPGWASAARPGVDLGVHWRHTTGADRQFDLTAWRRVSPQPDAYALVRQREPVYGARVEMKLTPARKTPLLLERGFVGLQLQGGGRISIKRSGGRPMVYYRSTF